MVWHLWRQASAGHNRPASVIGDRRRALAEYSLRTRFDELGFAALASTPG